MSSFSLLSFRKALSSLYSFTKALRTADAGITPLGKIREIRESLLPLLPFFTMTLPSPLPTTSRKAMGIRESRVRRWSIRHILIICQKAEKQGVEEHQNAVTEALLVVSRSVGVKAHEISYLIDLVVFLREHAGCGRTSCCGDRSPSGPLH